MPLRRPGLPVLTAAVLLGLLSIVGAGPAPATPGSPGTGADRRGATRGPEALRELRASGGLARAAERAGMSRDRLARVLSDPTTRLTARGAVFYAEELHAGTRTARSGAAADFTPVVPLADTFSLHSRPGAARTIYLDFDGQSVSGTWWNQTAYGAPGLPAGPHPAWSLDADPAFDDAELTAVQEVWARVAEDYAPFQVDVTTADPGQAALDRTGPSDDTFGVRVLVTPGASESQVICGGQCSGVAWVDAFAVDVTGDGTPGPAWVMTDLTWTNAAWEIADIASHEAGHTLGLQHDGQGTDAYYAGRGVWGPIMGSTLNPLVQWSDGDYTGATEQQDDLAVMDAHGAPRVVDDVGDTVGTAGSLGAAATGSASGVIGDRDDQDVLGYRHGACEVTFDLTAATPSPDLDARLRVLDRDGSVVASVDPPAATPDGRTLTGTGATWTGRLPAGRTYVEVDGVGQGAMPGAGYSDYGSVGRWTLAVTGCAPTRPGTPRRVRAASGAPGGAARATVTWARPGSDGGSPGTSYRVRVVRYDASGHVVRAWNADRPASARSWAPRLPRGGYRFRVAALNAVGRSALSARTALVRAR